MDYSELKKQMSEQKVEMTAKERLEAYNRGEEVDFIPYDLQSPDPALAEIFGYTTSQFGKDIDAKIGVIKRRQEEFGIDNFNVSLGLKRIGHSLGSVVLAPEHGIDYVEEHLLADSYDGIDALEPVDPYKNDVLLPILESTKRLKDKFPDLTLSTSVAGPITTAISVRPVEKALRDTRKDPDNLKKLLDICVESSLNWFRAFEKEFGKTNTGFSDPVTCQDILSRKQFEEFSLPYLQKLIDGTVDIMGMPPGAHICGKSNGIWEDLADAGLFFVSIDNCEDLAHAKELVGDRMRIAGNVPPVNVMKLGTIDDVIASVKDCLQRGADSPKGYILNTGCQVPLGTPKQNVEAFIYAARKYGRGARMGELPKGLSD
ncbi:MAG: uroporphyrinogen decarboxylase family protein [Peptoniphilus sp.]|nr:uroporphyrinogen decarboxylase family protein [Peptoniphilus sp.]MDD7362854.1 uroporphyrinogen decarboxylase family protein [Bacillota bacterium]MDY6043954.1 uroporphyrinogen decarboxylase family protein [Peptoniphilus sp.]